MDMDRFIVDVKASTGGVAVGEGDKDGDLVNVFSTRGVCESSSVIRCQAVVVYKSCKDKSREEHRRYTWEHCKDREGRPNYRAVPRSKLSRISFVYLS